MVPTIAALVPGGSARDDVARELTGVATIDWARDAAALVQRVAAGGVDAVVAGVEDERGASLAPTVAALAAEAPAVPVVVHAPMNGAALRKLLAVLTPGLRMACAVQPHERLEPVVRRVLSPDYRPPAGPVLLQHFVPLAPTRLRVFVALAAVAPPARRGVAAVAAWAGVSTRTIERRLARAGWPPARTVVQSFAALDAVWLMAEYGWSARRVQQVRRLPHESSVTRLLSRYCGSRPATLREDGGFSAALEHVTRALTTATRRP